MSEQEAIKVNWVQAVAGALAAMSSAVLLSTVGVAGTIIGAAVGSAIATIGSAIYAYYLETSKKRVAAASVLARDRAARARGRRKGAAASSGADESRTEQMDLADEDLSQAEDDLQQAEAIGPRQVSFGEVFRGLAWKRIGVVAFGIFVVAMGVILTFELLAGRSVSTITGGSDDGKRSSVSWGNDKRDDTPEPAPAPSETPSETPSEPTEEPTTESATPTPTPTEDTSDVPTEEPTTEEPSSSPSPPPVSSSEESSPSESSSP